MGDDLPTLMSQGQWKGRNMRELTTAQRAARLIQVATGEEYGDGEVVSDLVIGYAEPGYGTSESVVVFGNYNPKRWARDGDAPLTKAESMPDRLARALEMAGAEIEWSDEWASCVECYRAMRTSPDSYSWKLYGTWTDDGYMCADCARADVESSVEPYVNDAGKAITWCGSAELKAAGFTQWEPSDPHTYESGWHPGMDADPTVVLEEIHAADESVEVVFLLDEASQFYVGWSAWTRGVDDER